MNAPSLVIEPLLSSVAEPDSGFSVRSFSSAALAGAAPGEERQERRDCGSSHWLALPFHVQTLSSKVAARSGLDLS